MKTRKLFMLLLFSIFLTPIYSQWHMGGRVGMNGSSINYPDNTNPPYVYRMIGGIVFQYEFNKTISLASEIVYSNKGYKEKNVIYEDINTPLDLKVSLHYLDVPLLVRYKPYLGFNIIAGPQVGFLLKESIKYDNIKQSTNMLGQTNPVSLGLLMGIGYEWRNGIFFDLRYLLGLTSVYKNVDDFQNRSFDISLGYKFSLKSR